MYNEIKEIINHVIRRMNNGKPLLVPVRQVYQFATDLANALRDRFAASWYDRNMDDQRYLMIGATLEDSDSILKKIFDRALYASTDFEQYFRGFAGCAIFYANPGEVYSVCGGKRDVIFKGDTHGRYSYLPDYLTQAGVDSNTALSCVFGGYRVTDEKAFVPLLLVSEQGTYCQPDAVGNGDFSARMLATPSHARRYTVAGFEMTKFGSHRSSKAATDHH
ncbi:hypothetical protein L596_028619 [Steinernema carpocapsae]|nr:hypothetical protein L596_028619 [Steinernema carpocapsae]